MSSLGSAESPAHCCSSGSESSIDKSEIVAKNSWSKVGVSFSFPLPFPDKSIFFCFDKQHFPQSLFQSVMSQAWKVFHMPLCKGMVMTHWVLEENITAMQHGHSIRDLIRHAHPVGHLPVGFTRHEAIPSNLQNSITVFSLSALIFHVWVSSSHPQWVAQTKHTWGLTVFSHFYYAARRKNYHHALLLSRFANRCVKHDTKKLSLPTPMTLFSPKMSKTCP